MAGARQLRVDLDDDQYEAVVSAVESGAYASTSEVIVAALSEWQTQRFIDNIGVERLRELWDEGLASGPSVPFDPEEIKRRAREEFEKGR
ncbi:ribbon-helix-helix domain-containing protein [Aureimonas psammosilenae]|uniref:ribbon-helix-helix domain-containing protein n=1 Tax=Aureimonas psammosilenae TaxID=2495496 RepID=UPI00186A97C8|nr:type II toxin-antitoxin system ParD family antitoxin [Aureimonas psammosilenae]